MSVKIHPTAIVDRSAELGEGVVVGPYCVIGPEVRVGDETVLQNHVTVQERVTLGRENVVFPFAVLGAEPQDLKYSGRPTRVEIGDRNRIREHATVHRGTELGGGCTRIGSDCLVMVGVHIAHDCTVEDRVVIANNSMLGGHCLVEEGAAIGGGVGVHHFTCVGTLSFIGGMSRVARDVPPYCVVEGTRAEAKKINTTALMRRKWCDTEIEALRTAFRMLFRAGETSVREAIAQLRADPDAPRSVMRMCDFVERTDAGVHGRQLEKWRGGANPRR
ncbi:MAG: acyl-ACP--UDP-N-acetylglucosamine O-acyltransferase [Planctomycetota bacterium]